MAVLRIQENIKKADGTYDVVHKETEAGLVKFDDGKTLQQKSATVDGHIDCGITSDGGVHGIRYSGTNQRLERFDMSSEEWVSAVTVKEISVIISANNWVENSQTIYVDGITLNASGSVAPAQNISADQMSALCNAVLHVTGQADGTITVTAFRDVPTVDIPIIVSISGVAEMV